MSHIRCMQKIRVIICFLIKSWWQCHEICNLILSPHLHGLQIYLQVSSRAANSGQRWVTSFIVACIFHMWCFTYTQRWFSCTTYVKRCCEVNYLVFTSPPRKKINPNKSTYNFAGEAKKIRTLRHKLQKCIWFMCTLFVYRETSVEHSVHCSVKAYSVRHGIKQIS